MKKKTTTEKLIETLLANGYIEDKPHVTITKYRVFREASQCKQFVFIGKSGACRTGECVSRSMANELLRVRLLQKWEEMNE